MGISHQTMDGGKIRDSITIKAGVKIRAIPTKTKDGIIIPIKAGTIVTKAGDNSHKLKDGARIKVGVRARTKAGTITQTKAGDRARIKDGAMGPLQVGVIKDTLATHGVQPLHMVGTTHSA